MKKSMIIHPDELSKNQIDRMSKAGVDTIGIHPRGGAAAKDSLKELVETMKTKEFRELADYAVSKGFEIEYELHSAGYLMPRELFDEHPEFFRMDKTGIRTNDWNFCVSNEKALELYAKRASELALSLYRSGNNFYFWMDDGHDLHCHCPKCCDLSPSDQQLLVLNRVIEEIRKNIPNAKMAYLAYMDSIVPPKKITPDKNIFLEYAPFEKYTAKGENAQELISREFQMLKPLMKVFECRPCKVLEYWYDNSMYSGWKKPPKKLILNEREMKEDIKRYKENGFDYISTFACFLGADYDELFGPCDFSQFCKCCDGE